MSVSCMQMLRLLLNGWMNKWEVEDMKRTEVQSLSVYDLFKIPVKWINKDPEVTVIYRLDIDAELPSPERRQETALQSEETGNRTCTLTSQHTPYHNTYTCGSVALKKRNKIFKSHLRDIHFAFYLSPFFQLTVQCSSEYSIQSIESV